MNNENSACSMQENSEGKTASGQLAECIAFLEQCMADFEFANSHLSLCDKARNDLLHSLELYDTDAVARARTADKLRVCLLERRIYKDMAERCAPLAAVLRGKKHAGLLHTLSCVQGQMERVERNQQSRRYYPRVLNMDTLTFEEDSDFTNLRKAL